MQARSCMAGVDDAPDLLLPRQKGQSRQPSAPPRPNWCHVRWIEACSLQATLIARRRKEETVEGGGGGAPSCQFRPQTCLSGSEDPSAVTWRGRAATFLGSLT